MTKIPENLKYTKTHEWVRADGDIAVVGITDHAQHELSDIVYVELPALGRKVKAGEPCAVVESHKTAADIYSPVSGEIIEVNAGLQQNLGLINSDPYGEAWLFKVKLSDPAELNNLLSPADYAKLIGN